MTVKEIIKTSSVLLGRDDVYGYLSGEDFLDEDRARLQAEVNAFIKCVNLTLNEIATEYIPVIKTEIVNNYSGYIYFNSLEMNVLDVLGVYDGNGNKISYKVMPVCVKTGGQASKIEYSYIPPEYSLEEVIAYEEKLVPARVIAYGVASQICIIEGRFDQANVWEKRYKESLKNLIPLKRAKIKGRYWK